MQELESRFLVTFGSSMGTDVPRLQELSEVWPVECPLGLRKLLASDHFSNTESEIGRMVGRIDQKRRYLAIPKGGKGAFNRGILFRARQVEDTDLGLSQRRPNVARNGLKPG